MNDINQSVNDTAVSPRSTSGKKAAPKALINEPDSSGKKRKAPKIHVTPDSVEKENDTPPASTIDQEVPIKSKKKRAPKIKIDNESVSPEVSVKTKRSKAPKAVPYDDEFQIIESPDIEEFESPIEPKTKTKKSKKHKEPIQPDIDTFEELQVTNLDDAYQPNSEFSYDAPDMSSDALQPLESETSEYEKTIYDSYNNLASHVNFAQYLSNDQWCLSHPPKTARTEPKSRIRKMLPGGHKDEKSGTKPPVPKGKLMTRFRSGMNLLVHDPSNLLFGEQSKYDVNAEEEEPDGVDTDDLHRYAQKLRELEDQDREINPEFLILHDGKTVYAVHESDADGKVKISKRKPIYDRAADQKPDEQNEKKKLLARLKIPFGRNKDKDDKSDSSTPNSRSPRKAGRKLRDNESSTVPNEDPLMI